MYPHPSNYQFPMFPSPTFYPPAFTAMPVSPVFYNQSPQPCFNSPSLYPFSLANTPSTSFSSFNSASDFGNWSFPQSIPDSFSSPSVHSATGSATSSSTGSTTSSPEQQQQRQRTLENSSPKVISVPSSSSGSEERPKQENRRIRRGRMARRSDGVKRKRMSSESEDCDESEPRRIPLGTFNGRRVVLKLMGPRKPLE